MPESNFTLGLDIGPNSIGWVLLNKDTNKIVAKGVRVFAAGLDDLEQDGKGKSRNTKRRQARLVRRQIERRSRRQEKLGNLLEKAGLLQNGEVESGTCPYKLRAKALDERLEPNELGRVLYHLGQHRGFLSNRKSAPKDEKEEGVVKEGISQLAKDMREACARSLGEYFAKLDPHEQRIRGRYTSRKMYEDEFSRIWEKQKEFYPELLTDELRKSVHKAIFYQRPLKSQKDKIGGCQLENGQRRTPRALLDAQRFRYLSVLNNLEIENKPENIKLTDDQWNILAEYLENNAELTFAQARKLLKLKRTEKFNLEEGGEKRILGNRTSAALREVFGEKWDSLSEADKEQVVEDLRSIVKDETLIRRGVKKWGLDEESAKKLAQISLEEDYCDYSRRALRKLLPLLRQRKHVPTAIKEAYPERSARTAAPAETLPALKKCEDSSLKELRNPIVSRSLSEIRTVVNAVVKKHGKPSEIRIELAREVRLTSKQREAKWKEMRFREKERKSAAERITNEAGIENPSRADIEKVLLADECEWTCPYTGRKIQMSQLFGDQPQFDIEHIIPLHRSLDDSYMNKTLCEVDENRRVKQGRTPYEAYHGTDKWDGIIARVSKFPGRAGKEKLRRFQMDQQETEKFIQDFTGRQLNDTRYASKLAKKYLGLLYGGITDDGIDSSGKRRVHAVPAGQMTATLRRLWGLNSVLGDADLKTREDHRHHAVDAVVVALADPGWVKRLSESAQRARDEGRMRYAKVPPPWENFVEDVRKAVEEIKVSHAVNHRVRGALHEETFYGKPRKDENGKTFVHTRKPLNAISEKDVDDIIDPVIRKIVLDKLAELGESDPKKAFKAPANLPRDHQGRTIKHVRLRRHLEVFQVGEGHRARYVQTASNHHMEIVGVGKPDENGNYPKWEGHVVSMFEAYQRKKNKEPIVKRDWSEEAFPSRSSSPSPAGIRLSLRRKTVSETVSLFAPYGKTEAEHESSLCLSTMRAQRPIS